MTTKAAKFIRRLSWANSKSLSVEEMECMANSSDGMTLTERQKTLIRTAWRDQDKGEKGGPGLWILHRIFQRFPPVKPLFGLDCSFHISPDKSNNKKKTEGPESEEKVKIQKHAELFTNLLQMSVESVDALDDSLGPLLIAVGAKHYHFQKEVEFTSDIWELFGEVMFEHSKSWKCVNRAETLQAWKLLVFFIVHKMQKGYQLEKEEKEAGNTIINSTVSNIG